MLFQLVDPKTNMLYGIFDTHEKAFEKRLQVLLATDREFIIKKVEEPLDK